MKFLKVLPAAARELLQARKWYADQNPVKAEGFASEVQAAMEVVANFPQRHASDIRGTRRVFVKRFPYFVVYRERAEQIEVVAIAHNRPRAGYWAGRLK